jgi:glyceraldehyde 3-phosphate dehydrogenase
MAIKVGINGFGRIGRNIMRAAMGASDLDFVAVNDLTNAGTLAHLLKYDSILGNLKADIKADGDKITVDGDQFQVLTQKDPAQLPWGRSAWTSCSRARDGSPTARMPPSTLGPAPSGS